MPICEMKSKSTLLASSEANQDSDVVKVKKSKEQAYFNSYDFDAIEELSSQDDESLSGQNDATSLEVKIRVDGGTDKSSNVFEANVNTGKLNIGTISSAYLKRLTSYFTLHSRPQANDVSKVESKISRSSDSIGSSKAFCPGLNNEKCLDEKVANNFLLPRAVLKNQSAIVSANPMPVAAGTSVGLAHKCTCGGSNNNGGNGHKCEASTDNSGFIQCYEKCDRERVNSSSHYSTEKSGSSGYYSSNLCSTSSVEEHIYSEPVINVVEEAEADVEAGTVLPNTSLPPVLVGKLQNEIYRESNCNMISAKSGKVDATFQTLETSIEKLDRHLRSYPKYVGHQRTDSFVPCLTEECLRQFENLARKTLPTIMEGIDSNSTNPTKTADALTDDMDDSLMDIDLDAFLLANEVNKNVKKSSKQLNGIDNPAFVKREVLNVEAVENNYKCTKYINSCPEDAYKVESIIDGSNSDIRDKSLAFFLRKYEDQIHFESTKDMIEDIREKLKGLVETTNASGDTKVASSDLDKNIVSLKRELESYLTIMNKNSELELKRFCTGLVNNQKLLTITKAFERRKSVDSDKEFSVDFEKSSPDPTASVRCIDPNFELRRKTTVDIFPTHHSDFMHDLTIKHDVEGRKGDLNVSQLQRNLSFQRPTLKRKELQVKIDENEKNLFVEWHKNKPSIWELYYGTNRLNQTLSGKRGQLVKTATSILSYPSSRPESDFTLDLPRAEQLKLKMDKEKKFRHRCRILTTFLSLVFFLLTVMIVSLILTRGKRMFGSML